MPNCWALYLFVIVVCQVAMEGYLLQITCRRQDGALIFKPDDLLQFGMLGSAFAPPRGLLRLPLRGCNQQHIVEQIDIQLGLFFLCPR